MEISTKVKYKQLIISDSVGLKCEILVRYFFNTGSLVNVVHEHVSIIFLLTELNAGCVIFTYTVQVLLCDNSGLVCLLINVHNTVLDNIQQYLSLSGD